jgi:hypothetical protein
MKTVNPALVADDGGEFEKTNCIDIQSIAMQMQWEVRLKMAIE